jgi:hypothetical protein
MLRARPRFVALVTSNGLIRRCVQVQLRGLCSETPAARKSTAMSKRGLCSETPAARKSTAMSKITAFAKKHSGTIYNVGMTSSLCAFMATDLLTLRCLAVFGSSCAVWFNYQRAPPWNAVVWGLLFVSVNLFRIYQILNERKDPNFTSEEMDLFSRHFHQVSLFISNVFLERPFMLLSFSTELAVSSSPS